MLTGFSSLSLLSSDEKKILLKRGQKDFPWLESDDFFDFNKAFGEEDYIQKSQDDEVISGGNLSPGMILSAYKHSFFPWFSEEDPIIWFSPSLRFVIDKNSFHIPSRLKREIKKADFRITQNTAFDEVIENCALIKREGQKGTWITDDMLQAYRLLHKLGFAHSVEAWQGSELAGGFYGLYINEVFIGESMFSKVSGASKTAFALFSQDFFKSKKDLLIDAQIPSENIRRFGGFKIPRNRYLGILNS
ncbi:leucyl/phenylalanyl-tRNA--protein transferase [Treponema sp. OMZ 788]|uniref:leucyl/phenylalanyl-tRNA--protein transferase n=1 Tax=Treponema sp. OMZ 788 TaxID=2563664 RepID=UPI0020A27632|nr:leucyl/phenylalanyl-tRNA--protein transferase [Treponema sp. OMZ 788]UTC65129.1 leucyl/phenylalanyl-tRNA--protein transferase [Treponema sp. OMZ 788]